MGWSKSLLWWLNMKFPPLGLFFTQHEYRLQINKLGIIWWKTIGEKCPHISTNLCMWRIQTVAGNSQECFIDWLGIFFKAFIFCAYQVKCVLEHYFKVILLWGKQQDSARAQRLVKLQWNTENHKIKALYLYESNIHMFKKVIEFFKNMAYSRDTLKDKMASYGLIITPN